MANATHNTSACHSVRSARQVASLGVTTPGMLDVAERGISAQAVVRSLDVTGVVRDGYGT
ncbi:hypothetical protein [Streptomyces buecherae]|uniref:Uncharacterized protein n=1 Tax=Streptomyces buecherae TaxID=2763006 RepID=A0A7H8N289_9ACTN|nr:hypothetical protein [Streptomyces buecherae]QKW48489.1 hypothetical protein HUT08_01810 [Streptomyces buecherae]